MSHLFNEQPPSPPEHKTVEARILAYAEAIGWTFVSREEVVSREEAELRRGFQPQMTQRSADAEPQKEHLRKSAKSAVQSSSARAVPSSL